MILRRIRAWFIRAFFPDMVLCTDCRHPAWCHPGYWLFEDIGREITDCLGIFGRSGEPRSADLRPGVITCPCHRTYRQVAGRPSYMPYV